jgi:arylsulfatase A
VRKLEQLELAENTVFIFTADNGGLSTPEGADTPATDNAPLRAGKGYLYEGGLRVPLIVRWPHRVEAGSVNHTPVYSADLFATALDIAGVKNTSGVDGMSLLPLLTGRGQFKRDTLYWHYPHYSNQSVNAGHLDQPGAAIRQGDYKLIEFFQDQHVELYDLKNDLSEQHDLARSRPRLAAELRQKLSAWRRAVGAQMMTANPLYNAGK